MFRTILILVVFLSFPAVPSAQEPLFDNPAAEEPTSAFGSSLESQEKDFDHVKAEITRLLLDNKNLEVEYQSLKQQLDELKGSFETKEREFERIAPKDVAQERDHDRRINSLKALYQDVEKLKNEIMMKKSRTAYLTTQLIDLEDKQRLWKMKLSELQITQREIDLDIRVKEYELNERRRGKDEMVSQLQERVQQVLDEERELLSRISAIEEGVYYSPTKAMELERQNDELTLRVQTLEKELEFKHRETDILEKKKLLASKSRGQAIIRKQLEKTDLENQLQQLRKHAQQLDVLMEESLGRKAEKEGLLQSFVEMEQQNQKLRTQIAEIESKLNNISN